jgi:alpha-N-arabinofuranosidase
MTTEAATLLDPSQITIHPLLRFRRDDSAARCIVEVDPETAGPTVPATILCGFLEHLSFSIAGGVSAELLVNPTLAEDPNLTQRQRDELVANGRLLEQLHRGHDPEPFRAAWVSTPLATGFGVAVLDEPQPGVPFGWSTGSPGNVTPSVGRVGSGLRLRGPGSALRQAVYLPIDRTRRYVASAWVRVAPEAGVDSAAELEAGLRRRGDADSEALDTPLALGSMSLVGAAGWQRVQSELVVPDGLVKAGEPLDFVLRWLPGRASIDLLFDRVSLLPDDHVGGLDPAVIAKAAELQFARLRWPGGNYASTYHWRHGVGPIDDRPTEPNRAWGGLESHLVGSDEYIAFCAAIGAEPHITVNTGTGTPEEAAAWVEYCNGSADTPMGALRVSNGHPEPFHVRVWELGNETYGAWQAGFHGSAENARRCRDFARAMRSASPIPLELLACGNAFDFIEPGPDFDHVCADGRWHDELLEQAPDEIDGIALHALPMNDHRLSDVDDEEAHLAILAQVTTWERRFLPDLLRRCDASARDPGRPPIKVAMTEWGPLGEHPGRPMVENFGGVAYAAAFLGFVIRNVGRIPIASPNGFMHGGCLRKVGGLLFEDPLVTAQAQFLPFVGTSALATTITGPGYDVDHPADLGAVDRDVPFLDAVVCRHPETGELRAALGNRHPTRPLEVEIRIAGDDWPQRSMVEMLTADDVAARATPAEPDRFQVESRWIDSAGGALVVSVPPSSAVWVLVPPTVGAP